MSVQSTRIISVIDDYSPEIPTSEDIDRGFTDVEKWIQENSLPSSEDTILKACNVVMYEINQRSQVHSEVTPRCRKFISIVESANPSLLNEKINSILEPIKALLPKKLITFEIDDFEEAVIQEDPKFIPTLEEKVEALETDVVSIGFGLLETNEEKKLENKAALAKDLTAFFCTQILILTKSEENKSLFSHSCEKFLVGLLTDLAPSYVEKILEKIEKKTEALFQTQEPNLQEATLTLKNVKGLTEVSNDLYAPYILSLIQTWSMLICKHTKKVEETSSPSSLMPNLQSYLLKLCNVLGQPFLESVVQQMEKIILESIQVDEKNLVRVIPQEWKNLASSMTKNLNLVTEQIIEAIIQKYQFDANIFSLLKPCLLALFTKIGPKIFEECLYQISSTIYSTTEYFKAQVTQSLPLSHIEQQKKEKTAKKMSELTYLYFKDYVMGNPDSKNSPHLALMSEFIQGIINYCGPQIFLLLIKQRPKELTAEYKTNILNTLNSVQLFLKNYSATLTQLCGNKKVAEVSEEEIVASLQQKTLNLKLQLTLGEREKEKNQIAAILKPYLDEAKFHTLNNVEVLNSLAAHAPDLLLGFLDTLLNSSVKIGFIHRLLEINQPVELPKKAINQPIELPKKTSTITPKDEIENIQFEKMLKEKPHKDFAKQLGTTMKAIIKEIGNILHATGLSSLVHQGGAVLTNFLEKSIGNAIFKEIYQIMTQDRLDEKLDLIKSILWKEEDQKLTPTLAHCFSKKTEAIQEEDQLVRGALRGKLSEMFFKQKSWWLVKGVLESVCDQLSLELYRIFTSDQIFRIFLHDYLIQNTLINTQNTKTPKT